MSRQWTIHWEYGDRTEITTGLTWRQVIHIVSAANLPPASSMRIEERTRENDPMRLGP